MDCVSKLAAPQWKTESIWKKKWIVKKREKHNLLTSPLKEPFTCGDTLEWLEGLSESWEKSWGEEERKEKSNKSVWYPPPSAGQNARCNVNHDAQTVHPGRADITPTSCLCFMTWPIISSGSKGAEIDVYSEQADIFQLHNQQKRHLNISSAR